MILRSEAKSSLRLIDPGHVDGPARGKDGGTVVRKVHHGW